MSWVFRSFDVLLRISHCVSLLLFTSSWTLMVWGCFISFQVCVCVCVRQKQGFECKYTILSCVLGSLCHRLCGWLSFLVNCEVFARLQSCAETQALKHIISISPQILGRLFTDWRRSESLEVSREKGTVWCCCLSAFVLYMCLLWCKHTHTNTH